MTYGLILIYRSLIRGVLCIVIAVSSFASSWAQPQSVEDRLSVVHLRGEVRSSGISGSAGVALFRVGNARTRARGITAIEIDERGNHPCYIKVHRKSVRDPSEAFSIDLNRCGRKGPKGGGQPLAGWDIDLQLQDVGPLTVGIDTSSFFVRGIEVCKNGDKIKGLRLFSTKILPDGTLQDTGTVLPSRIISPRSRDYEGFYPGENVFRAVTPEYATMARANCSATGWNMPRFCGANEIAVAVNVHRTAGSQTPFDFTGIELLCREVHSGPLPGSAETILPGADLR